MQRGIVMTDGPEDEKKDLNNDKPEINRGVELLLRNRRKRPEASKTFQVKFSFFKREIHIYIEFSLDIKRNPP